MRQRKVLILLEKPDFDQLVGTAKANEREAYQEASFLLKGLLRQMATEADRELRQAVTPCGK